MRSCRFTQFMLVLSSLLDATMIPRMEALRT
jgi:hypothetical protein